VKTLISSGQAAISSAAGRQARQAVIFGVAGIFRKLRLVGGTS